MDVRRWFVFTIVCIVTMLDFGIIFSLGAMFVAMVETFQSDRSSTATVQSLLVGISLSFSEYNTEIFVYVKLKWLLAHDHIRISENLSVI